MLYRFLAFAALVFPLQAQESNKPNIIIILADDMGYSDVGCYGGEIATPAIDSLASGGLRLSRFHNGGMCVISRSSLLSGQHWTRAERAWKTTPLLSEQLKKNGYRTALIGKWHLDGDPMDRGFDHYFGFLGGFSDHFRGGPGYRLDRAEFREFGPDYYSTDAFTDRATAFIRSTPNSQPFFLYLSYQAPHNPLQAPASEIKKYRGNYLRGWAALRADRIAKQKALGIIDATNPLPAYPQYLPDWDSLSDAQRDLEDLRMATYAAMVDRMDQGIAQLIATIKQQHCFDNTLILFLSDNGSDPFSVADAQMAKLHKVPGDKSSNYQPGLGWAHVNNTPWRLNKISQHGGGITTGAIVHWPQGLKGTAGRISKSPVHMIDVLPTLMQCAGAKPESNCDGESFAALLNNETWQRQQALYFQFADNRAIRTHEWTLAAVDGGAWELYQTSIDPMETQDLAQQKPEIVEHLKTQWLTWWKQSTGKKSYQPVTTKGSPHYSPQGDRGTGVPYRPSAMPEH